MLKGIEFARRRDWPFPRHLRRLSVRSDRMRPQRARHQGRGHAPRTIPARKTSSFIRWPAPFPTAPRAHPNFPARYRKSACVRVPICSRTIRRTRSSEEFFCNFEVNPDYEWAAMEAGFPVVARGPQGEIRAIESPTHRFYIATLFQPQLSSKPGQAPSPGA